MKLNLGCGKTYKHDYINIDAYDATVADLITPAHCLPYASNSIERIDACHLIEHLGYITTRYALAEWYRVLKPKGILYIETPDIDAALTKYAAGSHTTRKELLTWIYGTEAPGMTHRLCYPTILLKSLLKQTGFTLTTIRHPRNHTQPSQYMTLTKQQNTISQMMAEVRAQLVRKEFLTTASNTILMAHEHFLDDLTARLSRYFKDQNPDELERLLFNGVICPQSTMLVFEQLKEAGLMTQTQTSSYTSLLTFLNETDSPTILHDLLTQCPCDPGTQRQAYSTVLAIAHQSLRKILDGKKDAAAIQQAWRDRSHAHTKPLYLFSQEIEEEQAGTLAYQAIREATLGKYTEAISKFNQAITLDRNRLLYFWNLARLHAAVNNLPDAKTSYLNAIQLVQQRKGKKTEQIRTRLNLEQHTIHPGQWIGAITEV